MCNLPLFSAKNLNFSDVSSCSLSYKESTIKRLRGTNRYKSKQKFLQKPPKIYQPGRVPVPEDLFCRHSYFPMHGFLLDKIVANLKRKKKLRQKISLYCPLKDRQVGTVPTKITVPGNQSISLFLLCYVFLAKGLGVAFSRLINFTLALLGLPIFSTHSMISFWLAWTLSTRDESSLHTHRFSFNIWQKLQRT